MRIGIIGGGISGIAAARMLKDKGQSVQLFEKEKIPGGLVRCEVIDQNLYHLVGGHVFNSKIGEVHDWFWPHFDIRSEFVEVKRNARIFLEDRYIDYPIELHLYQLREDLARKSISELIRVTGVKKKDPLNYEHFDAFLKKNFGPTLYEYYFKPYNTKIWQTDPEKIPMEWLSNKLPMSDSKEILTSNILREEEKEMVHKTFFYPVRGGSQFIIDRLAEGLEIKTGFEVKLIELKSGKWFINDFGPFDNVIYTADVRNLNRFLKIRDLSLIDQDFLKSFSGLNYHGTSNALCYTDKTDLSWLYIPETRFNAHRIIYTGNFSVHNNSTPERRTCIVEFSGEIKHSDMKEDIKKLPGNLEPISFHYEPATYVIQDKDTRKKINLLKKLMEPFGLFLSGRFAEWEYYNMDTAIASVMSNIVSRF
jgi:protoporphyrinogen oxidase